MDALRKAVSEGLQLKFTSSPSTDFFCPESKKLLLDPVKTGCCGRLLSARSASGKTYCPLCKGPNGPLKGFTVSPDPHFEATILNLQVYCCNFKNGCKWMGNLRQLVPHLAACVWCSQPPKNYSDADKSAQKNPTKETLCSSCNQTVSKSDYLKHVATCSTDLLPCDLAEVGCSALISRKDISSHMAENMLHHQFLISWQNLRITKEIHSKLDLDLVKQLQTKLAEKEMEISQLKKEITFLRGKSSTEESNSEEQGSGLAMEKERPHRKEKQALIEILTNQRRGGNGRDSDEPVQNTDSGQSVEYKKPMPAESTVYHPSLLSGNSNEPPKYSPSQAISQGVPSQGTSQGVPSQGTSQGVPSQGTSQGGPYQGGPSQGISGPSTNPRTTMFQGVIKQKLVTKLKRSLGMAIAHDMLYVVDSKGSIRCASLNGMVNYTIDNITLSSPQDLAIDEHMNIVVSDAGTHQVFKFSLDGNLLGAAGQSRGSRNGDFNTPIGVAIDAAGMIYVCDQLNHRIQIFNSKLEFMNAFGQKGNGPSQFFNPRGIALDSQWNIYVADYGNRCIKMFSVELLPLRTIGDGKTAGTLQTPTSVYLDHNDNLFVTDHALGHVNIYNNTGKFTRYFGQKLIEPNSVCVDAVGNVYLSENGEGGFFNQGRVLVYH